MCSQHCPIQHHDLQAFHVRMQLHRLCVRFRQARLPAGQEEAGLSAVQWTDKNHRSHRQMLHTGLIDLGDVNSSLRKLKSSKYMLYNHWPLPQQLTRCQALREKIREVVLSAPAKLVLI